MKIDGFDQATTVEMAATLPDWFDQYNTALAVVARPALGVVQGDVAVSAVSPHAMTLSAGDRTVTVGFERPVRGFEELVDAVVALAEAARRETSDRSPTDLEQVMSSVRTQQLHHGAVIECARLSASVGSVRIGPFPSFRSLGWDQAVSLFTGADGRPVPADMTFEQWRAMPIAPRARTCTIRGIDTDGVAEVWVALHGDDPLSMSTWAQRCMPGDPVSILGPRGRSAHRADVSRAVLVADETALGAATAMVDHLDVPCEIVGLVRGHRDEVDVAPTDADVTWLHEDIHSERRAAAVLDYLVSDDDTLYWGAGEYSMIRSLRRALRRQRGVPSSRVVLTAYWSAAL